MQYPELGCYTLPGQPRSAADVLSEVPEAERLGLGSVWISERLNIKEAAALCGAAGALTHDMGVVCGVTNPSTRHIMMLASLAATMSSMTGGRFALGLGRGVAAWWDAWGHPRVTTALLEDTADLLRRLWSGATVSGHRGPAGTFGTLSLGMSIDPPPLLLAALGPETQRLGGRAFDAVMLHPGFGPAAIATARDRVRVAAEEAGRDPDRVQVWACLVVLPDQPEDVAFTSLVRRFTGYMAIPGYGDAIVRANGWDLAVLDRIRAEPLLSADAGPEPFDPEALRRVTEIYPAEWLAEAGAIGPADACADKIMQQFEAGADGVILHGSPPADLAGVLKAYEAVRPTPRIRSTLPGGACHRLRG